MDFLLHAPLTEVASTADGKEDGKKAPLTEAERKAPLIEAKELLDGLLHGTDARSSASAAWPEEESEVTPPWKLRRHGGDSGKGTGRKGNYEALANAADQSPERCTSGPPEASKADSRPVRVPSKHPPQDLQELGVYVRIQGLKFQPKFNGRVCNVVSWDGGEGRWAVKLADGKELRIRNKNLVALKGALPAQGRDKGPPEREAASSSRPRKEEECDIALTSPEKSVVD